MTARTPSEGNREGRKPQSAAPISAASLASKLEASRAALIAEAATGENEATDDEEVLIGNLRAAGGPPPAVVIDSPFVLELRSLRSAFGAPLFFLLGVAQITTLRLQARWSRPFARRCRGGKRMLLCWVLNLLPMAMCSVKAAAMAPEGPSQQWWPPLPQTDLELWCSGQSTKTEQLALALQRVAADGALQSGGLWPPGVHAAGPRDVRDSCDG